MPLDEIEEAISLIHEEADEDANIIFGTVFDENMNGEVKITVIATGFDNQHEVFMPGSKTSETVSDVQYRTAPSYSPSDVKKDEDINVPTFIRRQAD
jgi:cell division protein FtsZ